MYDFGSMSSQHTTFFDSGLSSVLSNSTDNSITSGSPPSAFSSNYIERPGLLFSSLYSADSGVGAQNGFGLSSSGSPTSSNSSPTHHNAATIESLLEPFGLATSPDFAATLAQLTGQKQMDRQQSLNAGSTIQRPTSFSTTSSLFGNSEFGNPLGAPGTPIGSQMGHHHHSPFSTAPHTPLATPTSQGNVPPPKNPKLYKTELCRSWMDHGRCNYGERCQYAHGELEKRPVPRHPKYKTEACQSFHQSGYCPYGPRCHFIHNEAPSTPVSQYSTPVSTPAAPQQPPTTPSLYASQYHNMTLKQQQQQQQSAVSAPNQVLQRVYSLPNGGYGSAGESPACSSNDSGSESPNGSFSPGLDLEDTGPFSSGFMSVKQQKPAAPRAQTNRFLSYDQSSINDTQFSHMLNDLYQWNLEDSLAFPGFSASKWSTTTSSEEVTSPVVSSTTTSTPGRLPVFAQLSNPQ